MSEPDVRIEIVAYDPAWPTTYEVERQRIAAALGELARDIAHIGSTSVPGLAAKPIIDILVSVARLEPVAVYATPLARLGYEYFAVLGNAERLSFGRGSPHTHHIHIVQQGSAEEWRPLAFRDYLRAHPAVAREYGELKRALAARFALNRRGYVSAKTAFIRAVEAKAQG